MATFSAKNFAAANYNLFRPTYSTSFYEHLMKYHNGPTSLVVDVGCGPGTAARALLPFFDKVSGHDASAAMIATANSKAAENLPPQDFERVSFHVSSSEDMGDVESGTADMVTVAQAIHWFNHKLFFQEVLRVLKPGGTLAYWYYVDPVFPKYPALNKIADNFIYDDPRYLGSYWEQPGRNLLRGFLKDVAVPEHSFTQVKKFEFHAEQFEEGGPEKEPPLYIHQKVTLNDYKAYCLTSSAYHAYKLAHPDEQIDVLDLMVEEMNKEMGWTAKDNESKILDMVFNTGYVFAKKA
ncbi:hypothetical protein BABINDRAFT_162423 [Babjeviella inositovora NRRL Y-12698]|uniref:Methyltransferase type 11 domain-containing protein n=1 Tax=Babjeviella inositovora NRRL Y-12698 TaxID=984486 RepID=A0A1E3QM55_9ASCO|nr:uncharacterized protein BABINDRAFT_162423 [Babjeviella inositovora NRRL Y-12698]ODQ78730.1 hypothetical protein BABINDRAFT_162423 [Babjeviella inositovora NRRL Y-12698]